MDLGPLSSGAPHCGKQSVADFIGSDAPLCHGLSSQSLQSLVSKVRYRNGTDLLSQKNSRYD